jgi:hypothetical protein
VAREEKKETMKTQTRNELAHEAAERTIGHRHCDNPLCPECEFSKQIILGAINQAIEPLNKKYFDLADAIAKESSSCEELCNIARATRQERDQLKKELHYAEQAASDNRDYFDCLVKELAAVLQVEGKPSVIIEEVKKLKQQPRQEGGEVKSDETIHRSI